MALQPIRKVNITEQVFEQLKNNILAGKWAVGEKIPSETELSEIFGVSRSTVRQAIRSLADYGLIEVKLGAGSFVKQQDTGLFINGVIRSKLKQEDLLEVLDFCCVMEGGIAEMAALHATPEDVETLQQIQNGLNSTSTDFEQKARLDKEFHLKIAEMTGNSLVIQTFTIISEPLEKTIYEMYNTLGPSEGTKFHQQVIEALKKRDGILARKAMTEHAANRRLRYLTLCTEKQA